jgi:hypothetical protein
MITNTYFKNNNNYSSLTVATVSYLKLTSRRQFTQLAMKWSRASPMTDLLMIANKSCHQETRKKKKKLTE